MVVVGKANGLAILGLFNEDEGVQLNATPPEAINCIVSPAQIVVSFETKTGELPTLTVTVSVVEQVPFEVVTTYEVVVVGNASGFVAEGSESVPDGDHEIVAPD